MSLYLCIHVCEFPAQAMLRLRPELREKPVAVLEGEPPFQRVCAISRHAREIGVAHGMTRAEVESFPAVALLGRSAIEEEAARAVLLECAGTFSPRVEERSGASDFTCIADIAGTEKLFGAPDVVANNVCEQLVTMTVTCFVAVSGNFHAAVCLARGAHHPVTAIAPGEERHALAQLPLSVLDIDFEHAEIFSQWGIATLGALAELPEKDLIARIGQEGKRLRLLACGEHPHLFVPIEPAFALEERLELESPVEVLDSLLFGVSAMLEQLIVRVSARVLSLASVTAEFGLERGGIHTRTIRPALPSSDKALWLKLLHLDLIAHPPQAAVVSMVLKAKPGVAGKVQLGLFSPQLPEPSRLDVTLARIRAIVGDGRAGSAELKDTNKPDAFRMKNFSVMRAQVRTGASTHKAVGGKILAMRSLRPPEFVSVTIRNSSPHILYFRGEQYEVQCAYGPWRAAGGWWSGGQWSHEQWDIAAHARDSEHSTLLCCTTQDLIQNRWQIEALYD